MMNCPNCGSKGLMIKGTEYPNSTMTTPAIVYDTRLHDLLGIDPDPDPPKPNDGWRCFNCDEPYKENNND